MLKLTVAPTDEPVTAGEARAHCRIDAADENVGLDLSQHGEEAYVQFRLDEPIVAAPGDRFVLRAENASVHAPRQGESRGDDEAE